MRSSLALLLYSSPLFAQTPVETGSTFGFNPVVVAIIAVAAIAVGIYFYHRKHPSAGAAEVQSALDLLHKHADAAAPVALAANAQAATLQTQAETIQAQAAVIASPPIQAVINASPAAQTGQGGAPAIKPLATYQPMPPTTTAALSQPKGVTAMSNPPASTDQSALRPGETARLWFFNNQTGHGYFVDRAVLEGTATPTVAASPAGLTQDQNVLLALSWIPGPIGNGFRQQFDATFPDEGAANAAVNLYTNYSWNTAAVQVQAGGDPTQIVANMKAQTYQSAWDSLPTVDDINAMKAKLG